MTVTSDVVYMRGLDVFSGVVDRVGRQEWQRPSPCAGWRALDVLGHVGAATNMGAAILRGEPMRMDWPDPPGDSVTGSPADWWAGLADAARAALTGAELDAVVESPMGSRRVREGLAFPAVDLFVHAWDLARSTEAADEVEIPDDVIDFAYAMAEPLPEEMLRRPTTFGPPVTPSAGATRSQKLLAWTGRDPAL